jgi:hypothetical protein
MRSREVEVAIMKRIMSALSLLLCAFSFLLAGCGSPAAGTSTAASSEPAVAPVLFPVSVDGNGGYIDKTGALVVEPRFDLADDFSDGMAVVTENDKIGYIDASGSVVIQPQFYPVPDEDTAAFSDGLAAVLTGAGTDVRWGAIDKTGKLVIPAQYVVASKFSDGLCCVMVEKDGQQLWGYVDKMGTMVIEPRFKYPADFHEGMAVVRLDGRNFFIDRKGDEVLKLRRGMWSVGKGFSEGLVAVRDIFVEPQPLVGYIDKTGAVVIKLQFDWAYDFSEGLAAAAITENGVPKYGFIDKTGAWVIQPQFDIAYPFAEGLAVVGTLPPGKQRGFSEDYLYSFIDRTGNVVIRLQQNEIPRFAGFSGGVASFDVTTGAGDYPPDLRTYIDTTGKVIWPVR